ncbi:class I SAM-dependent methyltransferase [Ferruginibacter sp. SUN106]|uniref:class I SAM-dependent methyltransferase n=1 Tax=Ferruginibacter sp. SUN106 TaxID=2978348 RepID=UPI003D36792F
MSLPLHHINEEQAAVAFSKQAAQFDALYSGDTIIRYKRERIRNHVQQFILPASEVLELNSGTGEDAIWFAHQGHTVHATDISKGMQEQLQQKVRAANLQLQVTNELISFTQLHCLQQQKKYDYIFSNFAGLNCTGELDKVLQSFSALLHPGGKITLVILPKFCLWEFLLLFKGQFKTAFRRLFSSKGVTAHVEGEYFNCWYYNPSFVMRHLQNDFELLTVEGLCTLVPPSYIEGFGEKHSSVYNFLRNKEDKWKCKWPWKFIGDYYIISFKKKK